MITVSMEIKEHTRSWAGVTDSCKPPCECWLQNSLSVRVSSVLNHWAISSTSTPPHIQLLKTSLFCYMQYFCQRGRETGYAVNKWISKAGWHRSECPHGCCVWTLMQQCGIVKVLGKEAVILSTLEASTKSPLCVLPWWEEAPSCCPNVFPCCHRLSTLKPWTKINPGGCLQRYLGHSNIK